MITVTDGAAVPRLTSDTDLLQPQTRWCALAPQVLTGLYDPGSISHDCVAVLFGLVAAGRSVADT